MLLEIVKAFAVTPIIGVILQIPNPRVVFLLNDNLDYLHVFEYPTILVFLYPNK